MSPHNLGYDSSSSESSEKLCKGCGRMQPLVSFYVHPSTADGFRPKCKECICRDRQASRVSKRSPDSSDAPPVKRSKFFEPPPPTNDLYVMAMSHDPCGSVHGLKVGRSKNVTERALSLSAGLPFYMLVLATFRDCGELEEIVHDILGEHRNTDGRGREWFRVEFGTVLSAVYDAGRAPRPVCISTHVNGACGSESSPGASRCCPSVARGEEEGSGHYSEASGELCEEEGGEAGVSSGSTGER